MFFSWHLFLWDWFCQLDTPVAQIIPQANTSGTLMTPMLVNVGDNLTLSCSFHYGAPSTDLGFFSTLDPNQQPFITVFLGSRNMTSVFGTVIYQGTPQTPLQYKSLVSWIGNN